MTSINTEMLSSLVGGAGDTGDLTTSTISNLSDTASNTKGRDIAIVCVICCIALVLVISLGVVAYCTRKKGGGNHGTGGVSIKELKRGGSLPEHLTTSDDHENAKADPLTVVVHHSKNCGFCKKFAPVAKEVGQMTGVRIVFSEVGASEANRNAYQSLPNVNGVPAYTHNGDVLGIGYQDAGAFKALLESKVL